MFGQPNSVKPPMGDAECLMRKAIELGELS
jgi:hypothetical protein